MHVCLANDRLRISDRWAVIYILLASTVERDSKRERERERERKKEREKEREREREREREQRNCKESGCTDKRKANKKM